MDMLLSSPHSQGMMGAYGPPYMPMHGPHEGLLSVATMSPHPAGGHHLPPHHLQHGVPGYPGMPHQGKGRCSSHTCSVTSSRAAPAAGVHLARGLSRLAVNDHRSEKHTVSTHTDTHTRSAVHVKTDTQQQLTTHLYPN